MPSDFEQIHKQTFAERALSWSFVDEFLDTDRLRKLHYGNLVLRKQAHLFLTHGVIIAVAMLSCFWLVTANWGRIAGIAGLFGKDDKPVVECYEVVTSVTQLPPPPPLSAAEPPPVTPTSSTAPPPNVGKIKQVNQSEVPLQQTLATQKELKQAIQSHGAGSGAAGDETPMFVACEKTPGFLEKREPKYPEMARIAGITGKVFVAVLIGEDGRPLRAKVMKRVPADCEVFDAVSVKSLMESKYYPGIQNGSPIKVWLTVPITFKLD
ncbi:MAG: energy transducer TonB [Chlorobiaceae bacterium]